MIDSFVFFYQYLIYFYAIVATVIYLLLTVLGFIRISRMKAKYDESEEDLLLMNPELAPSISVVAPAFNEESIIIESVSSLLNLQYPNFEVVIVNDGSEDKTLELLIDAYDLEEVPFPYIEKVYCEPVRRIFRSVNPEFDKLTVVDKENGGTKADAMNAGVNVARYDYFINTDVDCILARDTLAKVILPVLDSETQVIAVGATMRIVNGCKIEGGEITRVRPPRPFFPIFQETEYLRSYLVAKMGWSAINAIPNVSGGFGLFDKSVVIEAGGFDPLSHAEDMDMTLRMIAHMRDNDRKYRIVQIPDTCCWTEGPPTLSVLARQRTRWGRGLFQIFTVHRKFLFNPRYGRMGLIVMPYAFFFEFLAPILELFGVLFLILLLFTQRINFNTFWLMLLFVYMIGMAMSIIAITNDLAIKKLYKTYGEYLKLVLFACFEAVLYHPFITFFSIRGYFQFLTRRNFKWGAMTRQGFSQESSSNITNVESPRTSFD